MPIHRDNFLILEMTGYHVDNQGHLIIVHQGQGRQVTDTIDTDQGRHLIVHHG